MSASVLLLILGLAGCRTWLHRIEPPPVPPPTGGVTGLPPAPATREYVLARLAMDGGDPVQADGHLRAALGLDPGDPELEVALAQVALAQGQRERAIRILEACAAAHPSDETVHVALGRTLLAMDRSVEAASVFRSQVQSGREESWAGLVEAWIRAGDREKAGAALAEWVAKAPPDVHGRWVRANQAIRLGAFCIAHDDLRVVLEERGAEKPFLDAYLGAARGCGRYRSALILLVRMTQAEPANADLYRHLAVLATEVGDPFLACEAWRQLDRLTGDPDVLLPAADAFIAAGRPMEALELLARVPAAAPGLRFHQARGMVALGDPKGALALYADEALALSTAREVQQVASMLGAIGRWEEAATVLQKGIDTLGPSREMSVDLARIHLRQGRETEAWDVLAQVRGPFPGADRLDRATLLVERGDVDGALAVLSTADVAWSDNAVFLGEAARIAVQAGRSAEAGEILESLHHRFPADPEVARLRGYVAMEAGQGEDAVRLYRLALALDPKAGIVQNDLAFTLAMLDRSLDEAAGLALDALEGDPANASYLDTLGWVYVRQGRLDEAIVELRHAVWMKPERRVLLEHLATALAAADRSAEAITVENRIRALRASEKEKHP